MGRVAAGVLGLGLSVKAVRMECMAPIANNNAAVDAKTRVTCPMARVHADPTGVVLSVTIVSLERTEQTVNNDVVHDVRMDCVTRAVACVMGALMGCMGPCVIRTALMTATQDCAISSQEFAYVKQDLMA